MPIPEISVRIHQNGRARSCEVFSRTKYNLDSNITLPTCLLSSKNLGESADSETRTSNVQQTPRVACRAWK